MHGQITLSYKNEVGFTFTTPRSDPLIWEELHEELQDELEVDTDFEWEHCYVHQIESNKGEDSISIIIKNSLSGDTMSIPFSSKESIAYIMKFMPGILINNASVLDVKLFIKKEKMI